MLGDGQITSERNLRQLMIMKFWRDVVGIKEVTDVPQRTLRFGEEAIELMQACGISKEEIYKLVDYVYDRPMGDPAQELGGCCCTLLVLAQIMGCSLEECEVEEINRIYAKGVEHFKKRNAEKNAAGLISRTLGNGTRQREEDKGTNINSKSMRDVL